MLDEASHVVAQPIDRQGDRLALAQGIGQTIKALHIALQSCGHVIMGFAELRSLHLGRQLGKEIANLRQVGAQPGFVVSGRGKANGRSAGRQIAIEHHAKCGLAFVDQVGQSLSNVAVVVVQTGFDLLTQCHQLIERKEIVAEFPGALLDCIDEFAPHHIIDRGPEITERGAQSVGALRRLDLLFGRSCLDELADRTLYVGYHRLEIIGIVHDLDGRSESVEQRRHAMHLYPAIGCQERQKRQQDRKAQVDPQCDRARSRERRRVTHRGVIPRGTFRPVNRVSAKQLRLIRRPSAALRCVPEHPTASSPDHRAQIR